MRARGSKPVMRFTSADCARVAPHAGAWIETSWGLAAGVRPASRPMRARGSKHFDEPINEMLSRSRPMRARGSKHRWLRRLRERLLSRPMRARGSKHSHGGHANPYGFRSRPMRARGSKLQSSMAPGVVTSRAPCGRVDRNYMALSGPNSGSSRPMRARGSKLDEATPHAGRLRSRPMRARGSKPQLLSRLARVRDVAPHAGAWIETVHRSTCPCCRKVAPHAGAWIETITPTRRLRGSCVAPHAGAWIETPRRLRPARR